MAGYEKNIGTSVTGKPIDVFVWKPEGDVRCVVQLVHGMAEHMARYDSVARALAEKGCLVVGHTHIGHGPQADIKGYFAAKDGWQCLIDDVHQIRQNVQKQHPGVPYVLLGHSMGSFVVRCYLMQYAEGLSAAVLSGTGWYDRPLVTAGRTLAKIMCALGQSKKPGLLIDKVAFGGSNKPFEPARTPFDWLSRDEQQVDAYVADPLCGFPFTNKGYQDMFDGLMALSDPDAAKNIPKNLPVLLLSGDKDPVGQMGQGVEKVAQQMRDAGVKDVTVRLFKDGRHEMFNETNAGEVYDFLAGWIDRVVSAG